MEPKPKETKEKVGWVEIALIAVLVAIVIISICALLGDKIYLVFPFLSQWFAG